jgi:nucleoside-diphosphate-sugar epimerase
MIAQQFCAYKNDPHVVVFASGVSNSKEFDPTAFEREEKLLISALQLNKRLVYFSTTSIEDLHVYKNTYVQHKIAMENLIRENSMNFQIFRLSQVLGDGGNPNTLVNSLKNKILNSEIINIYANSTRNIISSSDVKNIVTLFIERDDYVNKTINVATPWDLPITRIVESLTLFLKKEAKTKICNEGYPLHTSIPEILEIDYDFGAKNGPDYLQKIFKKYLV